MEQQVRNKGNGKEPPVEPVAGNGILNRRLFLEGAMFAAAAGGAGAAASAARAEQLAVPQWMKEPGAG